MVCETHYYQKPCLRMSCYQIKFEDNLLCYKKLAQVENSGPTFTVIEMTELLIKKVKDAVKSYLFFQWKVSMDVHY